MPKISATTRNRATSYLQAGVAPARATGFQARVRARIAGFLMSHSIIFAQVLDVNSKATQQEKRNLIAK